MAVRDDMSDDFVRLASSRVERDFWDAIELGVGTPDLDAELIRLLEQSPDASAVAMARREA